MRYYTSIGLIYLIVIVNGGSGTYNVDDAWRQMSGHTDHTATFSAITTVEEESGSSISSRSAPDLKSAASSYGGGGYGGGGYGGGGHGGGGYGGGGGGYGGGGGGYGGGGHGHGGGGYGSNGSNAVALLGLMLLINLLRDIINQITTTAAAGRKKRAIEDPFREWVTNLGQGGIQSLTYEIAATVLPLVSEFTEHGDQNRPLVCAQRSVCSANRRLTSNYGQMGKVFAKLASGAVLEHFHSNYPEGTFTQASINGRNLADCYTIYNECKLE